MATTTLAPPAVHSDTNSLDSASKLDLTWYQMAHLNIKQLFLVGCFLHLQNFSEFEVEYPSSEMAHIVKTSLSVDPELQPDKVFREINVIGNTLAIKFTATEGRYLRPSVSAFMDILVLATRTVEQFGPTFE